MKTYRAQFQKKRTLQFNIQYMQTYLHCLAQELLHFVRVYVSVLARGRNMNDHDCNESQNIANGRCMYMHMYIIYIYITI